MGAPPTHAADGRGLLNETRILAVAIAGGVIAAPVPARAQSTPPPATQVPPREAPAFAPAPAPPGTPAQGDNHSIVPDDQFRDALPALDPSLYEPLPPLDPAAPAFPP